VGQASRAVGDFDDADARALGGGAARRANEHVDVEGVVGEAGGGMADETGLIGRLHQPQQVSVVHLIQQHPPRRLHSPDRARVLVPWSVHDALLFVVAQGRGLQPSALRWLPAGPDLRCGLAEVRYVSRDEHAVEEVDCDLDGLLLLPGLHVHRNGQAVGEDEYAGRGGA